MGTTNSKYQRGLSEALFYAHTTEEGFVWLTREFAGELLAHLTLCEGRIAFLEHHVEEEERGHDND